LISDSPALVTLKPSTPSNWLVCRSVYSVKNAATLSSAAPPNAELAADFDALGGLVLELEDADDIEALTQVLGIDHGRIRVTVGANIEATGLEALHVGGVQHAVLEDVHLEGDQGVELLLLTLAAISS
jgi:hypothetical protein